MIDKIKDFLSPIKGGHYDGLKFSKWIMGGQRMGLFRFMVLFTLCITFFTGDSDDWDPKWTKSAVIYSLIGIILFFIYKTLQHWGDLKNHTSR